MEREKILNRIIRDMKLAEILTEENCGEARLYLNALSVASWEAAKRDVNNNCQKPVIQFDRTGKRIQRYDSVTEAAKILKCDITNLYKTIKKGKVSRKGYIFIYET